MSASTRAAVRMTVDEFLVWQPEDGSAWQLVDGDPQAMAPPDVTHGAIQSRFNQLVGAHLDAQGGGCRVVTTPGVVPRVGAHNNVRVPDIAISCAPFDEDGATLASPVLVVEILSPSNQRETWSNVWAYTSIASVEEILVLRTARIGAELLRRAPDGSWPDVPDPVTDGDLILDSIGFRAPLAELYRTTRLAKPT